MEGGWHALGPVEGFPDGMHTCEVADELVLVVRRGDSFHAVQALCPHKFGHLGEGHLAGLELTCPMHTATFDLRSGRPQPGQEWAGMLPVFDTRIRDGMLAVRLAAT